MTDRRLSASVGAENRAADGDQTPPGDQSDGERESPDGSMMISAQVLKNLTYVKSPFSQFLVC